MKVLSSKVFKVEKTTNNEQRITDIYLEGSIIKYFSLVDGPGYYEKGKPDSANVYCENGDTKYGADFTSIVSLVRELRKIEQLHKKNQPVS